MNGGYEVFGKRFCTYCGGNNMYYFIDEDKKPIGICIKCDNVDYCDGETVEDVKKRYGARLLPVPAGTRIV